MIFNELKSEVYNIEICNKRESLGIKQDCFGFLLHERNTFYLHANSKRYEIELFSHKERLREYFSQKNYGILVYVYAKSLKSISQIPFKEHLNISCLCLEHPIFIPNPPITLNVAIDEKIEKSLKKHEDFKDLNTKEEFLNALKNKIYISINNENYVFVSNNQGANNEIEIGKGLRFYAPNFAIDIKLEKKGKSFFSKATRISPIKHKPEASLKLYKINLTFEDGYTSSEIAKNLKELVASDASFLNAWSSYLEGEFTTIKEKVRGIGILPLQIKENKMVIDEKCKEFLTENDDLVILDEEQKKVYEKELEFLAQAPSLGSFLKDKAEKDKILGDLSKKKKEPLSVKIASIRNDRISVKQEEKDSEKNLDEYKQGYYFALATIKEVKQLRGHFKDKDRFMGANIANPLLALIMECDLEKEEDVSKIKPYLQAKNPSKNHVLTESIKDKVFKNEPTKTQEKAIEIALNSPDIAIIQGPPGTGKTTVITAIIECLYESFQEKNILGKEIFITAHQHDAVENLVSRIDVGCLPLIKTGTSSKKTEETNVHDYVEGMCQDIEKLTPKSNQIDISLRESVEKLLENYHCYEQNPSHKLEEVLLDMIEEPSISAYIDKDILEEVIEIRKDWEDETNLKERILPYIYALRTTLEGFEDDGKDNNLELAIRFEEVLKKEEAELLENVPSQGLQDYLEKLQDLKSCLLRGFTPKPMYAIASLKEKLEALIESIVTSTYENYKNKQEAREKAIVEYLDYIHLNYNQVQEVIKSYSNVAASTIGQKNKIDKKNETYEVVIVDEASRADPLSLISAMVGAKKIILVGDHRQLPHMYDKEIVKKEKLPEDLIRESLFARLRNKALALEKLDNIKRSITLDNQYRMHPILGNFVNEVFYERHDESEAFESPLGTTIGAIKDYFEHYLSSPPSIENIPCVWIDVPYNSLENDSNKECREKESEVICGLLKNYYNNKDLELNNKALSVGIIAYYNKQKEDIENRLRKNENLYDALKKEHHLEIGSVDAFQGKEFDIVFLSITKAEFKPDKRFFGFLKDEPRICVSMSRAKRCLIVVGDQKTFDNLEAKEHVHGLYEFLQLCRSKKGRAITYGN
ncbi:DEAD/DEAH box helicase [Helicobacter cetorum]|uniref:DEAD/DEAH box helicase n=1 Tax=Helicobacter cetorum TaxID=138563 RepID=UPI000CF02B3A|nr:AAA domain-containing protein [Helicobacter cetorum]